MSLVLFDFLELSTHLFLPVEAIMWNKVETEKSPTSTQPYTLAAQLCKGVEADMIRQ